VSFAKPRSSRSQSPRGRSQRFQIRPFRCRRAKSSRPGATALDRLVGRRRPQQSVGAIEINANHYRARSSAESRSKHRGDNAADVDIEGRPVLACAMSAPPSSCQRRGSILDAHPRISYAAEPHTQTGQARRSGRRATWSSNDVAVTKAASRTMRSPTIPRAGLTLREPVREPERPSSARPAIGRH
jgi:hypothetical protein